MNNYQERYKKKPVGFTDIDNGRLVRTVKHEERRKVHRAENFAKHRQVPEAHKIGEADTSKQSDIALKLERWKAKRDTQRKIEAQKKKPVFKVGVVHHKFYSPPITDRTNVKQQRSNVHKAKQCTTPTKRITRATCKRLEAKLTGSSATLAAAYAAGPKSTGTKILGKMLDPRRKHPVCSFAPENYSFKPPAGLPKMTLEKGIKLNAKEDEKPWPRASYPSVDTSTVRKMRNSLLRQNSSERIDSDWSETASPGNSSIKTVTRRLSSEDVSSKRTNKASKAVKIGKELDFPEDEEEIDSEIANAIDDPQDVEIVEKIEEFEDIAKSTDKTPPRSGTPVPVSFSPYIVSSRGKVSARKEQQMRMGIRRSSSNDVPTKDTIMQNLNISVEEEEQTARYFKFILQREIERLTELCNKWEAIMIEPDLTEDARCLINQAVGQTNLLIRKKFERFRGLVSDCETGKGEMLVQCKDLQGFWDMMYMEVRDCESRFLKLDFLRSKGWIEEQIAVTSSKVMGKKSASAKPAKICAKSSARSWILAARKANMSRQKDLNTDDDIVIATITTESKTEFGNGTPDSSRSSRKSMLPSGGEDRKGSTPKAMAKKTRKSLLKGIELSAASNSLRSPLAVIKISKMCKTPELRLDDTVSYVNSDQTPGKGILKKSEDSSLEVLCPPKSTRKVDFNDYVLLSQVPVESQVKEELQNSTDLGRALARIDNYDEDDPGDVNGHFMKNVTVRRVDKRLYFENDSFDETDSTDTAESAAVVAAIPESPAIPVTNIIPGTTLRSALKTANSWRKSIERSSNGALELSIEKEDPQQMSISTRVLRNRTVTIETPSKSNRRSVNLLAIDMLDISVDSSAKENHDPLGERQKGSDSDARDIVTVEPAIENRTKIRRSARKSVRFNADDCTACTPKRTHPMTPHTRISKKMSLLGEISRVSVVPLASGDLMSFDTPVKLPARIRRSSFK